MSGTSVGLTTHGQLAFFGTDLGTKECTGLVYTGGHVAVAKTSTEQCIAAIESLAESDRGFTLLALGPGLYRVKGVATGGTAIDMELNQAQADRLQSLSMAAETRRKQRDLRAAQTNHPGLWLKPANGAKSSSEAYADQLLSHVKKAFNAQKDVDELRDYSQEYQGDFAPTPQPQAQAYSRRGTPARYQDPPRIPLSPPRTQPAPVATAPAPSVELPKPNSARRAISRIDDTGGQS